MKSRELHPRHSAANICVFYSQTINIAGPRNTLKGTLLASVMPASIGLLVFSHKRLVLQVINSYFQLIVSKIYEFNGEASNTISMNCSTKRHSPNIGCFSFTR